MGSSWTGVLAKNTGVGCNLSATKPPNRDRKRKLNECPDSAGGKIGLSVRFWTLVSAFDPSYSRFAERVGERSLEFQRLPLLHRIEVLDNIWQQVSAKPFNRAASLEPSLC